MMKLMYTVCLVAIDPLLNRPQAGGGVTQWWFAVIVVVDWWYSNTRERQGCSTSTIDTIDTR